MGIAPRQIGWSNESNLLWQLSKQMDKLTGVTSANLSAIIADLATKVTNQLGTPSFRSDTLANLPTAGQTGRMFISTDTFAFYRDNGTGWDLIGGPGIGTVTGSGTTNYLSKWTGTSALGNSLVYDNGTNVGIGTTSPSSTMELYKATGTNYLYLSNGASGTNNGVVLRYNSVDYMGMIGQFTTGELKIGGFNTAGYFMTFYSNNAERMRLTPSGRLLIGTTTESTYELDVVGDIRSTLDANINGLTVGKGGGQIAENTAVGYQALNATATGRFAVAMGYQAGFSLTSGESNIFIGHEAGYSNTTGYANTIMGRRAGKYNVSGAANTIVGFESGFVVTGSSNSLFGASTGISLTTGNWNTYIGSESGRDVTTGAGNTIVGWNTGRGITTGQYNTIVGAQVSGLSASLSNTIILADGQGNQRLYIPSTGNVLIGTTTDGGYKLSVSGTTSLSGNTLVGGTLDIQGTIRVPTAYQANPLQLYKAYNGTNALIEFYGGTGSKLVYSTNTRILYPETNAGVSLGTSSLKYNNIYGTNGYFDTVLAIGTTSPDASALLDITSTTKGFLPPRMTNAQMTAIATPASGLMVYDTTNNKLNVFDGTNWVPLH